MRKSKIGFVEGECVREGMRVRDILWKRDRGREREEQGTKKSKIYDSVVASSLKNKEEY